MQLLHDLKEKMLDRTVTLQDAVDLKLTAVYVVAYRLLWRMAERQLIDSREQCGMM